MEKVSLKDIFLVFMKIGAFTIGGGYMLVPAIEDELRKHGWISEDELPDIVALSQSAPGLLTVNMAIFSGYKMRGLAGSIAATLGCVIPPFVIILLIAMFFTGIKDNHIVASLLGGVRPAAVAIITAYTIKLIRKGSHKWWAISITIATAALVALVKISPIYILLTLIVVSAAINLGRRKQQK